MLTAFPPLNLHWMVVFGLIPWFMSLQGLRGKSAWKSGYSFGILYSMGQLFFINQLVTRWTGNIVIALIPWLLCSSLMAVYFGLTGVFVASAWRAGRPWLIPFLWVGIEVFRSFIPVLAYPWGLVASPLWAYPALVQSAALGSIYLVSGLVVAANVTACVLLNGDPWRWAFPMPQVIVTAVVGSMIWWNIPQNRPIMKITAGQPGVDLAFGDGSTEAFHVSEAVRDLSAQAEASGSELLILPEGLGYGGETIPPQMPFSLSQTVPTVFGGRRGNNPTFQTAFGYDGSWSYVDKTRLVIFGEFVPGRGVIPFLDKFDLPSGDISPGETPIHPMRVGTVNVGPLVCFEGLFPDLSYRQSLLGAQLLAVISVDDWFMGTAAPDQLRAGSIWRAIETGLPMVRAASNGYTVIADGQGRVLAQAPLQCRTEITASVPVPAQSPTFPGLPTLPVACLFSPLALLSLPRKKPLPSS